MLQQVWKGMVAKTRAMLALITPLPFIVFGETAAMAPSCQIHRVRPGSCRGAS